MKSAGGIAALLLASAAPGPAAASAVQPAPAAPAAAEDWSAIARGDVEAAYRLFLDNHPGIHDPGNPGFPAQLKRAREAGLRQAAKASSLADYRDALGAFSAELQDGHAQAFAIMPNASARIVPGRQWPGFVAAWRGKQLLVHQAGEGAPAPVGSIILGCDGRSTQELVKARMIGGNFRAGEAGQWWFWAPQAFTASPTFLRMRPERCTFRLPSGGERAAQLRWSPAPDHLRDLLAAATDGEKTPIGLSEPRKGMFLVGLPDFQPDPEGIKAYRALYETLRQRRPELLSARAIVLDLRHNNGGSSAWPRQAAQALWGDEVVNRAMQHHFNKVRIWWRASEGNSAYLPQMAERIRAAGNSGIADAMARVGDGMAAARAKGEPFFVEGTDKPAAADLPPLLKPDFATPVYVITPGRCASACLDALDIFTRFDNVTLIGAPTSADSIYMEVRTEDLPSGRGRVVIPNKMWVGRPRRSGEVYRPKIEVTDLDWSSATFLDRIERDLRPGSAARSIDRPHP